MALVKGTNCGFLTASPTSNPDGGASGTMDGYTAVQNFTSPAGTNRIIELGWYQNSGSNDAAAYSMGVYDDDNGPNDLITAQSSGNSTTANTAGWYKYTGLDIEIDPETVYWIGVGCAGTSGANTVDREEGEGLGDIRHYGSLDSAPNYLTDPYSSTASGDYLLAFYAVYEEIPSTHTVTFHEGENGTITGDATQIINIGEDSTAVTAVENNGYVFDGWTGDMTGLTNPLVIENVTSDYDCTAEFGTWNIDNKNYMYRSDTSTCLFCGSEVESYEPFYCDCSSNNRNLWAGVREGRWGTASDDISHEDWTNAFWAMHWLCGRGKKVGFFNVSHIMSGNSQYDMSDPGDTTDSSITFTGSDIHTSLFNQFDSDGDIDIYLGLEVSNSDVEECIDLALRTWDQTCVKGVIVDVEWHKTDSSANYTYPISASEANTYLAAVRDRVPAGTLGLRHPLPSIMPDNTDFNSDIFVICDDQGFIGLGDSTTTGDWMIPKFKAYADAFPDRTCIYQIGYNDIWSGGGETRNDKTWWGSMDDPEYTITQTVYDYVIKDRTNQDHGIIWVDFSLQDEEVTLTDTPDSTRLWANCPLHDFGIAGVKLHVPANAPITSANYHKQKYW